MRTVYPRSLDPIYKNKILLKMDQTQKTVFDIFRSRYMEVGSGKEIQRDD